jgi:hypothetical protein
MVNEFGKQNKIRYLYNSENGNSSGVVSQEPDYIKVVDHPFYNYLKYPQTPVMYGRVSVLVGKLDNDQDYYSKTVFEFETPNELMLNFTGEDKGSTAIVQKYHYIFEDRTAKIGNLNAVKVYDKNQNVTSQSVLLYSDTLLNDNTNNYHGIYSEGTILSDRANGRVKQNRTTVITYPNVLKKITNTKDGVSSYSENLSWDLITGFVNQRLDKSSLGLYIKTIHKPAYSVAGYSELGSRSDNINNKNMLLQNASTYTYRSDASGSSLGLINASAQTWKKDWVNYRYCDGTQYTDFNETESVSSPVWRKGPAYVWKGEYSRLHSSLLERDGTQTFSIGTDDFNFASENSNLLWQYVGETLRFDHYGMPLESKDVNGIHSTVKMGYNDKTVIATASNAEYHEIAFSSAEDLITGQALFRWGVKLGDNTTVKYLSKNQTTTTHTGDAVVSVPSATEKSFIFNTSGLSANKRYRASVWTNSLNGRIYYKIGTTEGLSDPPSPTKVVKGWYRIDLDIPCREASLIWK